MMSVTARARGTGGFADHGDAKLAPGDVGLDHHLFAEGPAFGADIHGRGIGAFQHPIDPDRGAFCVGLHHVRVAASHAGAPPRADRRAPHPAPSHPKPPAQTWTCSCPCKERTRARRSEYRGWRAFRARPAPLHPRPKRREARSSTTSGLRAVSTCARSRPGVHCADPGAEVFATPPRSRARWRRKSPARRTRPPMRTATWRPSNGRAAGDDVIRRTPKSATSSRSWLTAG